MAFLYLYLALAPAIAIALYIYWKDKNEKEPITYLIGFFSPRWTDLHTCGYYQ